MKKLLILLFMSLSLTAQSSSGPDWYDAPLKACFEAAEKGLFIGKGKTEVWMNAPKNKYGNVSSTPFANLRCGTSYRNFIYDGKEYSLNRVLKKYPTSSTNYCTGLNAAGYAFCEYAEFNNLEDVNPEYYD